MRDIPRQRPPFRQEGLCARSLAAMDRGSPDAGQEDAACLLCRPPERMPGKAREAADNA